MIDPSLVSGHYTHGSLLDAIRQGVERLGLLPDDHVLDVGCGLGGTSRFIAPRYGCQVTGIDLTREYIETGRALCAWVGLSGRITLAEKSA